MTVEKPGVPDIQDITIRDTADGVFVDFRLDEGLEETDTHILWMRAKVPGYDFYQPVSGLEIYPGGKTATGAIPNKCVTCEAGTCSVRIEWYNESYPEDYNEDTFGERQKSEPFFWEGRFEPDWFGVDGYWHNTRVEFETRGIDHQISEARLYKRLTAEKDAAHDQRFLSIETGLWMSNIGHDVDRIAGISFEQPDMGQKWLRAWMDDILAALEEGE